MRIREAVLALLAPALAAAAAGPGRIVIVARPPHLELRPGASAELQMATDQAPTLRASVGTVHEARPVASGVFGATYDAPREPFPQVAIITARTTNGFGWVALPLEGTAELQVKTKPNGDATARVGDRVFGPVRADAQGRAVIPIVVPPGATHAMVGGRRVKLDAPPPSRPFAVLEPEFVSASAPAAVTVRVIAVTPSGEPRRAAPVRLKVSNGVVSAPLEVEPGVFEATWSVLPGEPGESTLSASILGDAGGAAQVTLERRAMPGEPRPQATRPPAIAAAPPPRSAASATRSTPSATPTPAPTPTPVQTAPTQTAPPPPSRATAPQQAAPVAEAPPAPRPTATPPASPSATAPAATAPAATPPAARPPAATPVETPRAAAPPAPNTSAPAAASSTPAPAGSPAPSNVRDDTRSAPSRPALSPAEQPTAAAPGASAPAAVTPPVAQAIPPPSPPTRVPSGPPAGVSTRPVIDRPPREAPPIEIGLSVRSGAAWDEEGLRAVTAGLQASLFPGFLGGYLGIAFDASALAVREDDLVAAAGRTVELSTASRVFPLQALALLRAPLLGGTLVAGGGGGSAYGTIRATARGQRTFEVSGSAPAFTALLGYGHRLGYGSLFVEVRGQHVGTIARQPVPGTLDLLGASLGYQLGF